MTLFRNSPSPQHQLTFRASRVSHWLSTLAVFLIVVSVAVQGYQLHSGHERMRGLVTLFALDGEQSLPTIFTACLHLAAASLLLTIALIEGRAGTRDAVRWRVLSAGFVFMAVYEACSLQQALGVPLQAMMSPGDRGILFFGWVIPGVVIVAVVGAYFLGFLRRLPTSTATAFIGSALLFVGGAIGVEMIGGWYSERYGEENQTYNLITSVEESLEMAGLIVFIRALMDYLAWRLGAIEVRFISVERTGAIGAANNTAATAATRLRRARCQADGLSPHPR